MSPARLFAAIVSSKAQLPACARLPFCRVEGGQVRTPSRKASLRGLYQSSTLAIRGLFLGIEKLNGPGSELRVAGL